MPLFRPEAHRPGVDARLTPQNCPACPEVWFRSGFAEQDTLGSWVLTPKGEFLWSAAPTDELIAIFGADHVFEGGRDGYYLTMEQARQAIDVDQVHGVHYVDDYNDEYQGYYVCKDDEDHTPFAEAHVAERIR